MSTQIKVPALPESVADATIAKWYKQVGDTVSRDENLVDLETDKVMLEVPSMADGVITAISKAEGDTVVSDEIICTIDESASTQDSAQKEQQTQNEVAPQEAASSSNQEVVATPSKCRDEVDEDNCSCS